MSHVHVHVSRTQSTSRILVYIPCSTTRLNLTTSMVMPTVPCGLESTPLHSTCALEQCSMPRQEWEILRLREASVTSDGMLSCYTPFLLAIVQRRVADSASAAAASRGLESSPPPPSPSTSCPRALCAEALWALSEYAVLSPGLAAEVLPLAEGLASDTREHIQVADWLGC